MYEQFFHLRADPFALSPNPGFCYPHASYKKAKIFMQFALARGEGFLLITGKPGTGKTTLVKELLGELEMTRYKVSALVSTQLDAEDLLRSVAFAFGIPVETSNKATVLQRLTRYLAGRRSDRLSTILIVDEAQDLSEPALEELRLLTNYEQDNKPLLQVFLVGQPQLNNKLDASSMEQFRQRITVAATMEPMLEHDVEKYIQHRLSLVGWNHDPDFNEDMYSSIYQCTNGIPRQINTLCSRLLLHGFVEGKHKLTMNDLIAVVDELSQEHLSLSGNLAIPRPEQVIDLTAASLAADFKNLH